MFSDLPGHTTPNGGSVPIEILVTPLKPDITILDRRNKTFNIFELTCPLEGNIKTRNQQKTEKYSHFLTDVEAYKPSLVCFEIGSRGYISPDNHTRLKTLHTFCKPGIQLKKFRENISSISLYSSYAIFLNSGSTLVM